MALIALALLSACWRAPELPPGDPERPDIIVLSIDTLRADHLGAWGYERDTSPYLDALAGGGVRFSSAWSPSSWTLPSHATMLSGALPVRHGAIEDDLSVASDVPWLPEALREAGYGTAGVVATMFVSDRFGFDRGFQHFHDFGIDSERANLSGSVDANDVLDHAFGWATRQAAGQPLFLFLHVYDVHYAYDPPGDWGEKFDRRPRPGDLKYRRYAHYIDHPVAPDQMAHQVAQYDEEIAWVDHVFGQFVERWRGRRPAIVVVTSDHGEEFGERGSWGHAHTLWPEQLHVPWIVSGPGIGAREIAERVGLEDLAPTVAGLAGVDLPASDGVDRSASVRGGAIAEPGQVAARFAETSRFKTLRYRWHEPPYDLHLDLTTGATSLCDLAADPRCERDLAADQPERVAAMQGALMRWLGEPWVARRAGEVSSDGVFVINGALDPGPVALPLGQTFGLHPADATLRSGGRPWAALGGTRPGPDDAVGWSGAAGAAGTVELTEREREQLEALGYVQ